MASAAQYIVLTFVRAYRYTSLRVSILLYTCAYYIILHTSPAGKTRNKNDTQEGIIPCFSCSAPRQSSRPRVRIFAVFTEDRFFFFFSSFLLNGFRTLFKCPHKLSDSGSASARGGSNTRIYNTRTRAHAGTTMIYTGRIQHYRIFHPILCETAIKAVYQPPSSRPCARMHICKVGSPRHHPRCTPPSFAPSTMYIYTLRLIRGGRNTPCARGPR